MLSFSLALALAANACGSTDGEPGAAGATGAAGAAGTAGHRSRGTTGATGTWAQPARSARPVTRARPSRRAFSTSGSASGRTRTARASTSSITDRGVASATFDPTKRPVAAFDWDNTIMKNDIGDATFFWMIKHDKIRQPAGLDWATTSAALTTDAKAALNAACDGLAAAGDALPTSTNTDCADALFKIYDGLKTPGGLDAWTPSYATTDKINFAYAWVAQLTAGSTPDEVRGYARAAYAENSAAPIGATQTVGTTTGLNGYVRVYERDDRSHRHAPGQRLRRVDHDGVAAVHRRCDLERGRRRAEPRARHPERRDRAASSRRTSRAAGRSPTATTR